MHRSDLQQLAELRLREARALLWSGNPCGAYYLAGYAVECALKACIARKTKEFDFPDKRRVNDAFVHSPDKLMIVAELKPELDAEIAANDIFKNYWAQVKGWSEEKRYETLITQTQAADLILAISDPVHGVLTWLRNYW